MQTAEPLCLDLSPSYGLSLFLLLLHLSAFLALVFVLEPLWLFGIGLLLWVSLFFSWRSLAGYRSLSCLHERQWALTDKKGLRQSVQLSGGVMLGALLLLSFVGENGKRCSLVLWADSADAQQLRRLRVKLTLLKSTW
ncbi:MAG: hypothetical protein Q9O24_09695 [Gammaproteobacteria bacterium]|nr:hypothetical protein [Gammaproteobacteria bacterium]